MVGLGGALLALTGWLYARFNEQVEHHLFKGSTLHSFWNTHSHDMGKARSRAAGEPLKVFLHVPRTSGDAMQVGQCYGCIFQKVACVLCVSQTMPMTVQVSR